VLTQKILALHHLYAILPEKHGEGSSIITDELWGIRKLFDVMPGSLAVRTKASRTHYRATNSRD
jgi:hypothetical protein